MSLFFSLVPVIYLAGNIFLYYRLLRRVKSTPVVCKVLLSFVFCLLALSMPVSMFLRNAELPYAVTAAIFRSGAVWMIFMFYTSLSLLLFDLVRLVVPAFKAGLCTAVFIVACLLVYGNYNYSHPDVVPLDITLDKKMDGSVKLAVVSDIHLGYGTGKSELRRFVNMINSLEADAVLIVGDLFDNSVAPAIEERFDEELALLNAPQGVYMVPGNHEYISGIEECKAFLADTPVRMLGDTVVELPSGVQIAFLEDCTKKTRKRPEALLADVDHSKPLVFLAHQPLYMVESDTLGVDVRFSGHTHHGQSWPINYVTDAIFKQSHGYRKWSHSHVWVSSGLSLWGPHIRLGTKGDMAIVTLRGNSAE